MRAVIAERDRRAGRHMARVARAAGYVAEVIEAAEPPEALDRADVLVADGFDGDAVINALRRRPQMRAVLLTAEPITGALELAAGGAAIANICGRPDFNAPPSGRELLMALRRLASPRPPAPLPAFLDWGASITSRSIADSADREAALGDAAAMTASLGVPGRIAELVAELVWELVMNAMYGAPVDDRGAPKYSADRRAELSLPPAEQPRFAVGTDGRRLAVQVADPFGRLERAALFSGLARGLAGEQDRRRGGAGLGFAVCHRASSALFADVAPGSETRVTALVPLDLNLRELRGRARSLHYFDAAAPVRDPR